MPELPDIVVYIESLERRIAGDTLKAIRIANPFVLRSVEPGIEEATGRRVMRISRIGKRIAIGLDGGISIVIHLMISGRLKWIPPGAKIPARLGLAAMDFTAGTLLLTEASKKKRASLRLILGDDALHALDPGGIDPLGADLEAFRAALTRENHTIKRALTDPRLLSGIGNAYSDEILHRARISPVRLTARMPTEEIERLRTACREVLTEWTARLREETGDRFPEKVTAFREEMAVHGRYRKPCPDCGTPVQRIVYADNETNYCARCQTGGRLLADRALSRLLKGDWPRSIEDLDEEGRQDQDIEASSEAESAPAPASRVARRARPPAAPTGPGTSRSKPRSP